MKPSMKVRRFYPLQVLRKLNGKCLATLTSGQRAALTFFMQCSRRYGASIWITNDAPAAALLAAGTADAAEQIKAQYQSKIKVQMQHQKFIRRVIC